MSRMKRRMFLKSASAAAVAGSVIGSTGCLPLFGSGAQAAGNARRIEEWRNQRFGMFIHWGPVSLKGTEIGWSRGAQVPVEEYDNLYRQFNPTLFDAGAWVKTARETGMKYLVFTTKHHDGFCMWDTKQTDYNIMRSPYGRDVVTELSAACRRQGIAFSTYHSVCDWHHPDFPLTSPGGRVRRQASNLDRYEQYLRAQVKELITGYGPLQVLWFDVPQEFGEQRGLALEQWTRSLQPDIIINNRSGARGDYDTPEQRVGKYQEDRPWETCMTLCRQWAWKPNDDMKSLKECIQALVLCAGGDGNLLFNVGPMPDGRIEPRQVERLREMGAWLAKNGESIYGTRGGPWKPTRAVASTRKGNVIYIHVLRWDGDAVTLPDIPIRIQAARVSGGGKVEVRQANGELILRVPPAERQEIDTLVRLEISGSAMSLKAVELPSLVKATASNVFRNRTSEYGPEMAFDNDPQTRWATDAGTRQAWIAAEFPRSLSIQRVRIEEALEQRVQKFEFQHLDGGQWQTIFPGTTIGPWFQKTFAPVRGQSFRLNILDATEGPTITDIELFEK
jgi:alpha-L-fucosidase